MTGFGRNTGSPSKPVFSHSTIHCGNQQPEDVGRSVDLLRLQPGRWLIRIGSETDSIEAKARADTTWA
jgi:hypothetical protein